jgi:hypothetical protein
MTNADREIYNASQLNKIIDDEKSIIKPDGYNMSTGIPVKSYYYKDFDGWVKIYSDDTATLSGAGRPSEYFLKKSKAFDKAKLLSESSKSIDKIFKRVKKSSNKLKRCSCKKK